MRVNEIPALVSFLALAKNLSIDIKDPSTPLRSAQDDSFGVLRDSQDDSKRSRCRE